MKPLKVLALTKYGRLGASSRMRTLQYLPWFAAGGLDVTVQPLLDDTQLERRYTTGQYGAFTLLQAYGRRLQALMSRQSFDLLWIEKEALKWFPLWAELKMLRGTPYVLDFDDAEFHHYDLHRRAWVRALFGRRLDGLMSNASLVVAGNSYLAQRASDAGAPRVEVVPTVVDLDRYSVAGAKASAEDRGVPRVVWIGSPSTVKYLEIIAEPLRALAESNPFILRVIGGGQIEVPGIHTEVMPWSEATEVGAIESADIGVMPLAESPWEKGKCGYKLIQYMACSLPAIGSAVGANTEIVGHGETGFLARSNDDWLAALQSLLSDTELRKRMGQAGRARVEQHYCLQKTGPELTGLLTHVALARQ